MKQATFRVIRFPLATGDRYIALAWNYDQAVLLSSADHATYTEARAALDVACMQHSVELKWFDGSYVNEKDCLIPDDRMHV
jgi:hypothetical protein